ncbi:hypothetical protein QE410_002515 [Microbacterium sp. SORGH_AS 1204]|uniref:hypothetical protein n=1 Tax=Microbacterium sp. SORGH_AS_1204 TaxID=3041785 RepID=UPI00278E4AC5|nr:hypothetical protein [Microbacterium sp. SORGH_AS_1204]MDQ1137716.1 hypothetical protein [Microbacterium sp. SORGH_AS_1204]
MNARRRARIPAVLGAAALVVSLTAVPAAAAVPSAGTLTNLDHLDFLLDQATPPVGVTGHSTYRQAQEPTLLAPWTSADARDGGTFERMGGGPLDPATGDWGQGAFTADDTTRAAVVYIRDWEQTGDAESRRKAYELLRTVAYHQTTEGPSAGEVVRWMQPDGDLNPSAEPMELPGPSDSRPGSWTARTVWALGEGYAAFVDDDPAFAAFLKDRLALSRGAIERDVLTSYGQYVESDGVEVPAWLVADGADAAAEAVLGLTAAVRAGDDSSATAARQLAEGVAAMASGSTRQWPYGALLPRAQSPAMWHAQGSQTPAALAAAGDIFDDDALVEPAIADATGFTTTLLTAGGPDIGWYPSPTDRVQIASGAGSRVQSLLALADTTGAESFAQLAGLHAAWFFGANHAGAQMYDPATGVTYDGLQPDGTVDRDSGAESTIHGVLTAIALDAHPAVAARATALSSVENRVGLEYVEAEDATSTDGTVFAPESLWTGESRWSGDGLTLTPRQSATWDLGPSDTRRWIEPVVSTVPGVATQSVWRGGGVLSITGPQQGISPAPGALLPYGLPAAVAASDLRVTALRGDLTLDGLIVRPWISRLVLGGDAYGELVLSSAIAPQLSIIGTDKVRSSVKVYDTAGSLVRATSTDGAVSVVIPAGGFAIAEG